MRRITMTCSVNPSGLTSGYSLDGGVGGSLSPNANYTDSTGTSRSIRTIATGLSPSGPNTLSFGVDSSPAPPDNDSTFHSIVVNGTTYLRSNATSVTNPPTGTSWNYALGAGPQPGQLPTSGEITVDVKFEA